MYVPHPTTSPAASTITAPTLGLGDVKPTPARASSRARRRNDSSVWVRVATETLGHGEETQQYVTKDSIACGAEKRNPRPHPVRQWQRHYDPGGRVARGQACLRTDPQDEEVCHRVFVVRAPAKSAPENDVCGFPPCSPVGPLSVRTPANSGKQRFHKFL